MKKQPVLITIIALVLFLMPLACNVFALELGSQAPEIKIAEWVQGEGAAAVASGKNGITVLEFWSSWCPACREAVSHMSDIQAKFEKEGVTVIAISDQNPEEVRDFVKEMGDKMTYPVAIDDNEQTNRAYMEAFGVDTIPHTFIIGKQGQILWHGNPLSNLEEILDEIVSGNYDLEVAVQQAQAEKDCEKAIALLEAYQALALSPGEEALAKEVGLRIVMYAKSDLQFLSLFAMTLVEKFDDHQTALKAMEQVMLHPEGQQPLYLIAYASVLFDAGDSKKAIETQEMAISLCQDDEERADFVDTLEYYQKAL